MELFLSIRQPKLRLPMSRLGRGSAQRSARSALPRSWESDAVRLLNTLFPSAEPCCPYTAPGRQGDPASLLLGKGMAPAFSSLLSNPGPGDTPAWERELKGFGGVKVPIWPAIPSHTVPLYCGHHVLKLSCRQTQFWLLHNFIFGYRMYSVNELANPKSLSFPQNIVSVTS